MQLWLFSTCSLRGTLEPYHPRYLTKEQAIPCMHSAQFGELCRGMLMAFLPERLYVSQMQALALEAFGEDVRRLIFSSYLEKSHLRRWLGCQLTDAVNPSINVTSSVIHARTLDQINTSIIVLRNVCCCTLFVAHHVYHARSPNCTTTHYRVHFQCY